MQLIHLKNLLLLVIMMCLALLGCKDENAKVVQKQFDVETYKSVYRYPDAMLTALVRLAARGNISVEKLVEEKKISFAASDENSVFQPYGARPFPMDKLKLFTSSPDFIYSLSANVTGSGTEKADLVAFLPAVTEEFCNRVNTDILGENAPIQWVDFSLYIKPYPDEGIFQTLTPLKGGYQSETTPAGCIRDKSGQYYFYKLVLAL